MTRIAIAELKAHLSAEIKKVKEGETLVILEHRRPVARIVPLSSQVTLSRSAVRPPEWKPYTSLMTADPSDFLAAERSDSW